MADTAGLFKPQPPPEMATTPWAVKLVLALVTTLLAAGGALLLTSRGEALLIDFYAAAKLMLCF